MSSKGGVTMPLFHCIFNNFDSITHFMRTYDEVLYRQLKNTYAVCISDNSGLNRKIVAGFIVKTSYSHNDPEFLNAITKIGLSTKELSSYIGSNTSFLPARLGVMGSEPLSESEMLNVMLQQYLKFSTAGNA